MKYDYGRQQWTTPDYLHVELYYVQWTGLATSMTYKMSFLFIYYYIMRSEEGRGNQMILKKKLKSAQNISNIHIIHWLILLVHYDVSFIMIIYNDHLWSWLWFIIKAHLILIFFLCFSLSFSYFYLVSESAHTSGTCSSETCNSLVRNYQTHSAMHSQIYLTCTVQQAHGTYKNKQYYTVPTPQPRRNLNHATTRSEDNNITMSSPVQHLYFTQLPTDKLPTSITQLNLQLKSNSSILLVTFCRRINNT